MTKGEPPSKKAKTDVPEYGSKEYWEQRYANQTEEQPDHSWYFTYEELRPILLPVLLGSPREEEEEEASDHDDEWVADDPNDSSDYQQHQALGEDETNDDEQETTYTSPATATTTSNERMMSSNTKDTGTNESNSVNGIEKEENDGSSDDGSSSVYEGVEELVDDTVSSHQTPGLATDGPIKVLEIGCGDVPLGEHLAKDIPFQEILCTDYSETVIQKLLQLQIPQLQFRTMDARKMDLPNESYQVILDKGTLDAMLSDTEQGVANCVSIVSECARVLTAPGCMMIVSHLNAHTANGVRWLHEVVFPGLRSIDSKTAQFHMEVHGNDAPDSSSTEDANDTESAGPAVYLIHKHATEKGDDGDDRNDVENEEIECPIPVQFFTY